MNVKNIDNHGADYRACAALLTQLQGILTDQAGSIEFVYWVPVIGLHGGKADDGIKTVF